LFINLTPFRYLFGNPIPFTLPRRAYPLPLDKGKGEIFSLEGLRPSITPFVEERGKHRF